MSGLFKIMFTIVPIIIFSGFIFTFALIFSPKLKSKFMGQQLKSAKYMLDENENILKEINKKSADISKEGIEIKARAVKNGFTNNIYCKHCGESIGSDSSFCKYCGEKQ